jgi:hypothetical protein
MPGFAYAIQRDRHRPKRALSTFRETALTVFGSAIGLLIFLVALAVWAVCNSAVLKSLQLAISKPTEYVADNTILVIGFLIGYLVLATAIAALLGSKMVRTRFRSFFRLKGIDPDNSAWWTLFDQPPVKVDPNSGWRAVAGLTLEDGTWLQGRVAGWNMSSDDGPDRDLVIEKPLWIRRPGKDVVAYPGAEAVAVNASRIKWLDVHYVEVAKPS